MDTRICRRIGTGTMVVAAIVATMMTGPVRAQTPGAGDGTGPNPPASTPPGNAAGTPPSAPSSSGTAPNQLGNGVVKPPPGPPPEGDATQAPLPDCTPPKCGTPQIMQ
ncbi:hypothetical protein [Ancylobacter oerskovii]|uniref:Uncharacterized protein n=1 Tax=Ancylobacter oerskovii TaxID=459519 RepID=A0ABW4YTW9_9HYPH|nr:hypothetical protein [Ancylobacter oerskovii]MBS7543776.1 hypothetical protein [Ancylobacter oerskovii]